MAAQTSGTKSLKEYLRRYESINEEEKKKKKKKKKVKSDGPGVLVVDEDPVWHKPIKLEEEENDSADEEKPQVDEDIEVKRMKRLEQLRAKWANNAIAEDGSGWVSLSPKRANFVNQDSDMSPPCRQSTRNDTPSPEPSERPSAGGKDADLSPPWQQQKRHYIPPPESDLSPPRKRRIQNDTPSPDPPSKPSREVADFSPPRQPRKHHYSPSPEPDTKLRYSNSPLPDLSPPRKQRIGKDADLSPPRQQRRRHHTPSPEPQNSPGPDLSPPRKSRKGVDKLASLDLSPQRLPKNSSSIMNGSSHDKKGSSDLVSSKDRPKTGLISGRDIQEEISKLKKDDLLRFQQMDPKMTGQGAEPIYRDKKGQRISKEEFLKSKQKVEEKPKEKKLEWGKGLAQKREAEVRLQELELEKEKPFARTRDDPELDKMLKERLRWGDPMAHLVKVTFFTLFDFNML
ncbi:BUD13 homolog isoform X2 [Jatropha curcas]|uniref:BUD13 homolog isoform X2 n=1 Tax=Jatropha curcas TaxID=180498 RepID=UPI0009D6FDA3|nr:BUD13 homolog isoform X2 [Jatropha curcas]